MVVKIRRVFLIISAFFYVVLLAGCSGHPAAGTWVTDSDDALFDSITVDFDGKATLRPVDAKQPVNNCYWQASSGNNIDLQCGTSEKEEGEIHYRLTISEPAVAVLTKADQVIGNYRRLP